MRIALIDSNRNAKVYSIALLKLGAWRKLLGDKCVLFENKLPNENQNFDEIWISTTFTYDIPYVRGFIKAAQKKCSRVRIGGISVSLLPDFFKCDGVDIHQGLVPEAEKLSPDYDLLQNKPAYSITYTSRGCIRKCEFCMVTQLEPTFYHRPNWPEDILAGTTNILFYDNNWFAKPFKQLEYDVNVIKELQERKGIKNVDFNQGLDCRLITDKKADLLKGISIYPVRFSFDSMEQDGYYQNAIIMMAKRGFREFRTYVLYNFKDTPEDFYYRLRESMELSCKLGIKVKSFPMRFQPIMKIDKNRDYTGTHWTKQKRAAFRILLSNCGAFTGCITFSEKYEFEYWLGKNAEEFNKLLSYPDINKLAKRRRAALRFSRAIQRSGLKGAKTF